MNLARSDRSIVAFRPTWRPSSQRRWKKAPPNRYDTAQELADDLKRFLDDEPIRASRPTSSSSGLPNGREGISRLSPRRPVSWPSCCLGRFWRRPSFGEKSSAPRWHWTMRKVSASTLRTRQSRQLEQQPRVRRWSQFFVNDLMGSIESRESLGKFDYRGGSRRRRRTQAGRTV